MPKKGKPTKEQLQIEELEAQLAAREQELAQRQDELSEEARRSTEASSKVASQESELDAARAQLEQAISRVQASEELQAEADRRAQEEAAAAQGAQSELQAQLEEKANELVDLRQKAENATNELDLIRFDNSQARKMLDVAIGECEFALAHSYYIVVELKSTSEKRSTDISQVSQRPVFNNPAMLLKYPEHPDEVLVVSAYISIPDPTAVGAPPATRLLGEAKLPMSLEVPEGANASRRVVRNVTFMRMNASSVGQDSGEALVVGRSTIAMQVKVLTPSEILKKEPEEDATAPLPASMPSLDRSLWPARPFVHCVRALVHGVHGVPLPPPGGSSVARVVLRLLHPQGGIVHESASPRTEVTEIEPSFDLHSQAGKSADLPMGHEITLPVVSEDTSQLTVQLALEVATVAEGDGSGATTAALMDLRWPLEVMPALHPLHLHAKAFGDVSQVMPTTRQSKPGMVVSLVREPTHEALETLEDGASFGTEVRVHGVPNHRPLPELVEGSLIALCLDPSGVLGTAANIKVPVVTYSYDQRQAMASFMEDYFKGPRAASRPRYFLTPVLSSLTRTPEWSQFVVRCLAPRSALPNLSMLLFQQGRRRGLDPEAPLSGSLLGFANIDAAALIPQQGEPLTRPFMLDLRLLNAPGSACSLEVDTRLWPRTTRPGASPLGQAAGRNGIEPPTSALGQALQAAGPFTGQGGAPGQSVAALAQGGGTPAALQQEASEFRLNHQLSVQLAQEFNMRAAALKRAGEEIVQLREQVRALKTESAQLKARLAAEEDIEAKAGHMPLPEGLESLSGAELGVKLQKALERYRAEKAKTEEIGKHLQAALKEAASGKALARKMEELERVHLQQNRELQRLQEDAKKIDTYKQTAKTQEKVIAKLEKILEGSLQEVQKAQKVQADVERMKAENARLRERCERLAAGTGGQGEADQLRQRIADKESEVVRLEGVIGGMRAERERLRQEAERERSRAEAAEQRAASQSSLANQRAQDASVAAAAAERRSELGSLGLNNSDGSSEFMAAVLGSGGGGQEEQKLREQLLKEHQRLKDAEVKKADWEQKCQMAEKRLEDIQEEMAEDRTKHAEQVASLKVEIAEKDQRIEELESSVGEAQAAAQADDTASKQAAAQAALNRAQQTGSAADIAEAAEKAQAAGVDPTAVENARNAVAKKQEVVDDLRRAMRSKQIEDLQRAVDAAEVAGVKAVELEEAKNALADRQKAIVGLNNAVASGNREAMRKAIDDAYSVGAVGKELDDARKALGDKNKISDALRKAEKFGSVEELKASIQEAERANDLSKELDDARAALSQKERAQQMLQRAERSGNTDELQRAIDEATAMRADGRDIDKARQALSQRHQKQALVELGRAQRIGDVDDLRKAIEQCESAGVGDRELESSWEKLGEMMKAVDGLKKAIKSGNVEQLRAAIEDAELKDIKGRELDTARSSLSEKGKVMSSLRAAVNSGNIDAIRKAVDDAEAVQATGADLDTARIVLNDKGKTQSEATDKLTKMLKLGTVAALREAVQEAENAGLSGKVMEEAWTTFGKKAKALDDVNTMFKFGTAEDLYKAVKEAEAHLVVQEDLQDAYKHLGKKLGRRGFQKMAAKK